MRAAFPFAACALVLALAGCSSPRSVAVPKDDAIATAGDAGAFTVEMGYDESRAFVPFVDGQIVTKEHGPQGGYHVWVSLAVHGDAASAFLLQLEVLQGSALVSRTASTWPIEENLVPGTRLLALARAFVEETTKGPIVLRATVIDPDTQGWARVERSVVLQ